MSATPSAEVPAATPEQAAADAAIGWHFQQRYAQELESCHVPWLPAVPPQPQLLWLNDDLARELGLDPAALREQQGVAALAGSRVPGGARPIAQAYAGHQFGGFSPQLGDGRALLLGELTDTQGRLRDIAFKGSGRTPFSRGGDGKAALGPVLREVLIGEAMQALGVPTTRALAAVGTGETVRRDPPAPGALLVRVAASHLRVGTLQYFAARGQLDELRRVADHAIARHDPDLVDHPDRHALLLGRVAERQAALIAQWMGLGFIHGVMNTDNMTLSGETIDYGPCAFMEAHDPATVYSSIDHSGRYAYSNQPLIARWNLARLAEALLPLMRPPGATEDDAATRQAMARATAVIDAFAQRYRHHWLAVMRAKLGLADAMPLRADDPALRVQADASDANGHSEYQKEGHREAEASAATGQADTHARQAEAFLALLQRGRVDHTLAFHALRQALPIQAAGPGDPEPLRAVFRSGDGAEASAPDDLLRALDAWLAEWAQLLSALPAALAPQRMATMRRANPWMIPRNLQVEAALQAAVSAGDLEPFARLLQALREPFDAREADADLAQPAGAQALKGYQTFCGT